MWGPALSRTFEYVEPPERLPTMHGSLHLILATESDRSRRTSAVRDRQVASLRRSVFARRPGRDGARGVPTRGTPGTDSPLGHPAAASYRGR